VPGEFGHCTLLNSTLRPDALRTERLPLFIVSGLIAADAGLLANAERLSPMGDKRL
jgi:hypothetical protein